MRKENKNSKKDQISEIKKKLFGEANAKHDSIAETSLNLF